MQVWIVEHFFLHEKVPNNFWIFVPVDNGLNIYVPHVDKNPKIKRLDKKTFFYLDGGCPAARRQVILSLVVFAVRAESSLYANCGEAPICGVDRAIECRLPAIRTVSRSG